jgi:hypothetical protein
MKTTTVIESFTPTKSGRLIQNATAACPPLSSFGWVQDYFDCPLQPAVIQFNNGAYTDPSMQIVAETRKV